LLRRWRSKVGGHLAACVVLLFSPLGVKPKGKNKEEMEVEKEEDAELDMVSTLPFIQANLQQYCCIKS
jgi:hypothetical protein